jgi:pimeloyl-ACP methyl ester carboxylesterase
MASTTTAAAETDLDHYGPSGRSEWLDVDWGAHQKWLSVAGRRANVIDIGDGPPVVFIHGLAGCWQNWLENIPHFARSHRVIAFDLPGFGHSEMPPEDISIPGYGRWVDELLDQLGIDAAPIVGNSMGGFIGAELAINLSQRVDRLVLVSAAALWSERRTAAPLTTFARLSEAYAAWFATKWEWALRRPRLRQFSLMTVVRHPDRLPVELCYELMQGSGKDGFVPALQALSSHRIRDRLGDIECPTLIVWGARDQLVPASQAREYERLIDGARTVIMPDTGHVPMVERPARFNQVVEEFLAE